MLLYFKPTDPLYLVGTGVYTSELIEFIKEEHSGVVLGVSKEEYFALPDNAQCIIGFQRMNYRINFLQESAQLNRRWPTYVHPSTIISKTSIFGQGTVIGPNSCIGHSVTIGDFCSVAPLVSIGHGSTIGFNNALSPGTIIGGSTTVGNNVYFGQSSSIRDKINICDDVKFAMTSAVTKNIVEPGEYFGNKKSGLLTGKF